MNYRDRIALALSKQESGFCFLERFRASRARNKAFEERRRMRKNSIVMAGGEKIRCEGIRCHL